MKPRLKKKRSGSSRKTRAQKIAPETSTHFQRFWLLGPVSLIVFTHAYTTIIGMWTMFSFVDSETAFVIGILEVFLFPFIAGLFLTKLVVWFHDRPREANWYSDPGLLD